MSYGQGVLQGLDMYRDFSQQRRANQRNDASLKIAREQQDIANYQQAEIENKDRAKDIVGDIDGHFGEQGFSDYRSKPWAKLVAEAPDLAAKLANSKPGFTKFLDENGDNVQAEVVRFDKRDVNGENVYVPMVKRFDTGEVVSMTVNRSATDTAVVQLSEEGLTTKLDKLWRGAVKNGGYQNDMSHLVGRQAALQQHENKLVRDRSVTTAVSEGILQVVENDGSITPEAKTEFFDAVSEVDDAQELIKIAEAQGIDVDALVAEGEEAANAEIGATAPEGSLEKLLFDHGVTREVWETADKERRTMLLERINKTQDLDSLLDKTIGRAGAQIDRLTSSNFDKIANIGNDIAESRVGRYFGLSKLTDDPAPTRKNTAVADKEEEIKRQEATHTAEDISNAFTTPPPFELTAENLQKAILDGTNKPTAEQQNEMVSFLDSKGIKTMTDFERQVLENKIADNDARMVAFVASMSHDGSAQQKDKVAQGLMNLIERGSMDTTAYQQASIDDSKSARRTAQYTAKTARDQLRFDMQKYDETAIPGVLEDAENLYNKVAQTAGLMDDEGNFTDDGFNATGDEARIMGREITKYMGLKGLKAKGPKSLEAHLAGMKASVGLYVQALANDDKNDFFSKENMLDFFRPDAVGAQSFDLRQLRVGSVKDGKPQSIAYVGPDGVVSQTVPLAEIQREHPQLARIVLTAAEANSKANK